MGLVKGSKGFIKEFKEFISRGNVVDMAVGVIIGGAFTAIVNSLVDDIVNPLLGLITGGTDFSTLSFGFGDAQFMYGSFITAVINFLLVALVLFLVIWVLRRFGVSFETDTVSATHILRFFATHTPLSALSLLQ